MSDAQRREERRRQDVFMMTHPSEWPQLVLPIKRYQNGRMSVAVLSASLDDVPTFAIYEGANMFADGSTWGAPRPLTLAEVEQLVDDGWEVD